MADGHLTIPLDEETADHLQAAADAVGESPEAYAARAIMLALEAERWAVADARIEEYERTGVAEDAEVFVARLRASAKAKA